MNTSRRSRQKNNDCDRTAMCEREQERTSFCEHLARCIINHSSRARSRRIRADRAQREGNGMGIVWLPHGKSDDIILAEH